MQSYTREFNGKNQFWTPSNLGFTNSLIDNKLANLEEVDISGLLPKNEAENTYLKKQDAEKKYLKITDAIVPKFHSYYAFTTDGTDIKKVLTNIGNYHGNIQIDLPSTVSDGIKLVFIDFHVQSLKKAALDALTFTLDEKSNWGSPGRQNRSVFKGICVEKGDGSRTPYIYKYSNSDIFTGKIRTLYLHPFFDDEKSYTDEIYLRTTQSAPEINMKIVSF